MTLASPRPESINYAETQLARIRAKRLALEQATGTSPRAPSLGVIAQLKEQAAALDRNARMRRDMQGLKSQTGKPRAESEGSQVKFVAAKHAYLSNVEGHLGDYLLQLELHRQSRHEVALLASEVARLRAQRDPIAEDIRAAAAIHLEQVDMAARQRAAQAVSKAQAELRAKSPVRAPKLTPAKAPAVAAVGRARSPGAEAAVGLQDSAREEGLDGSGALDGPQPQPQLLTARYRSARAVQASDGAAAAAATAGPRTLRQDVQQSWPLGIGRVQQQPHTHTASSSQQLHQHPAYAPLFSSGQFPMYPYAPPQPPMQQPYPYMPMPMPMPVYMPMPMPMPMPYMSAPMVMPQQAYLQPGGAQQAAMAASFWPMAGMAPPQEQPVAAAPVQQQQAAVQQQQQPAAMPFSTAPQPMAAVAVAADPPPLPVQQASAAAAASAPAPEAPPAAAPMAPPAAAVKHATSAAGQPTVHRTVAHLPPPPVAPPAPSLLARLPVATASAAAPTLEARAVAAAVVQPAATAAATVAEGPAAVVPAAAVPAPAAAPSVEPQQHPTIVQQETQLAAQRPALNPPLAAPWEPLPPPAQQQQQQRQSRELTFAGGIAASAAGATVAAPTAPAPTALSGLALSALLLGSASSRAPLPALPETAPSSVASSLGGADVAAAAAVGSGAADAVRTEHWPTPSAWHSDSLQRTPQPDESLPSPRKVLEASLSAPRSRVSSDSPRRSREEPLGLSRDESVSIGSAIQGSGSRRITLDSLPEPQSPADEADAAGGAGASSRSGGGGPTSLTRPDSPTRLGTSASGRPASRLSAVALPDDGDLSLAAAAGSSSGNAGDGGQGTAAGGGANAASVGGGAGEHAAAASAASARLFQGTLKVRTSDVLQHSDGSLGGDDAPTAGGTPSSRTPSRDGRGRVVMSGNEVILSGSTSPTHRPGSPTHKVNSPKTSPTARLAHTHESLSVFEDDYPRFGSARYGPELEASLAKVRMPDIAEDGASVQDRESELASAEQAQGSGQQAGSKELGSGAGAGSGGSRGSSGSGSSGDSRGSWPSAPNLNKSLSPKSAVQQSLERDRPVSAFEVKSMSAWHGGGGGSGAPSVESEDPRGVRGADPPSPSKGDQVADTMDAAADALAQYAAGKPPQAGRSKSLKVPLLNVDLSVTSLPKPSTLSAAASLGRTGSQSLSVSQSMDRSTGASFNASGDIVTRDAVAAAAATVGGQHQQQSFPYGRPPLHTSANVTASLPGGSTSARELGRAATFSTASRSMNAQQFGTAKVASGRATVGAVKFGSASMRSSDRASGGKIPSLIKAVIEHSFGDDFEDEDEDGEEGFGGGGGVGGMGGGAGGMSGDFEEDEAGLAEVTLDGCSHVSGAESLASWGVHGVRTSAGAGSGAPAMAGAAYSRRSAESGTSPVKGGLGGSLRRSHDDDFGDDF